MSPRGPLALGLLLAVSAVGCSSSSLPSSPVPAPSTAGGALSPPPPPFEQLTTAGITIADPQGRLTDGCVLVADAESERSRGLMDVTDLGRFDGMVFSFPDPTQASFYMFQTKLPLTIAFIGADRRAVSVLDMAPCLEAIGSACPLYSADGPYVDALEVPQSSDLPLSVGVTVNVGGPC